MLFIYTIWPHALVQSCSAAWAMLAGALGTPVLRARGANALAHSNLARTQLTSAGNAAALLVERRRRRPKGKQLLQMTRVAFLRIELKSSPLLSAYCKHRKLANHNISNNKQHAARLTLPDHSEIVADDRWSSCYRRGSALIVMMLLLFH